MSHVVHSLYPQLPRPLRLRMRFSYFHSTDDILCILLWLKASGDVVILGDVQRSQVGNINKIIVQNVQDLGESRDLDSKQIWKFYDPLSLAYQWIIIHAASTVPKPPDRISTYRLAVLTFYVEFLTLSEA
jgi:hypothetical protein